MKKNKKALIGALVGLGVCAAALSGNEDAEETAASIEAAAQFQMQSSATETDEISPDSSESVYIEISSEIETEENAPTKEIATEYIAAIEASTEATTEAATATPTTAPTEAPTQTAVVAEVTTAATPTGEIVYITESGGKYHRSGCRYLKDSKIEISLEDAVAKGYEPCKVCGP